MKKTIELLNKHRSSTPSKWREEALFRRDNRFWLRYSQAIAMMTLDAMEHKGFTQKTLADKMGCTQQYVSKLLKGQENLSIQTIAKLEEALDIDIIAEALAPVSGYTAPNPVPDSARQVYLSEPDAPEYGTR